MILVKTNSIYFLFNSTFGAKSNNSIRPSRKNLKRKIKKIVKDAKPWAHRARCQLLKPNITVGGPDPIHIAKPDGQVLGEYSMKLEPLHVRDVCDINLCRQDIR